MPPSHAYLTGEALRSSGVLQESNRLFFHPLGLALGLFRDERKEKEELYVIRVDSLHGIRFGDPPDPKLAAAFREFREVRHGIREETLGYVIQPLPALRKAGVTAKQELLEEEEYDPTAGDLRQRLKDGNLRQLETACSLLLRLIAPSADDPMVHPMAHGFLCIQRRPIPGGISRTLTIKEPGEEAFLPLMERAPLWGLEKGTAILQGLLSVIHRRAGSGFLGKDADPQGGAR